jgi:hypothetical protein
MVELLLKCNILSLEEGITFQKTLGKGICADIQRCLASCRVTVPEY